MPAFRHHKDNFATFTALFFLLVCILTITGCNSSGGGGGESADEGDSLIIESPLSEYWAMSQVKHLDAEGLLIPQVSASPRSDGSVGIAYFTDGTDYGSENRYNINYIIWNPETEQIVSEETLDPLPPESGGEGIDNCSGLALALDDLDYPVIAYQGGFYRDMFPASEQSDVMFSIRGDQEWAEYPGAMGYVTRNPFYDGLAGSDLSVAVDSQGDIHICYQFYYEGMDSYNFEFPDLNYVKHEAASLGDTIPDGDWADIEETVYGSDFTQTSAVHRGIGYKCKLLLDNTDNPVVFFAENTDYTNTYYGLWFARRNTNGTWDRQSVERVSSGWAIGDISAAKAPNGTFAVAYSKICLDCDDDEGDHLKYAVQSGTSWDVQVVDESSVCGHNPSLAFDSQGNPAIVYFDQQSHSGHTREYMKFAKPNGSTWTTEIVIDDYDFGHHNSLWFDDNDRPYICSYSEAIDDIAIFGKVTSE